MKKKRPHKEEVEDTNFEIGEGSAFEQLGFKNHKELEAKSIIVMEIWKAIKKKKLTQTEAAEVLGVSQPKLSSLLNGRFEGFSVERLFKFLNKLDTDVTITFQFEPEKQRKRAARVIACPSSNEPHCREPMAAKAR
jgi:predicted XRE-type DNA-binding protein